MKKSELKKEIAELKRKLSLVAMEPDSTEANSIIEEEKYKFAREQAFWASHPAAKTLMGQLSVLIPKSYPELIKKFPIINGQAIPYIFPGFNTRW